MLYLEALIVRAGAAFRRDPGDLSRVRLFNVAGLAVHAIRRVDLQFLTAFTVRNHFIHIGRTEIGTGIAKIGDASGRA